jgi:hypothetical protein
MATKKISELQAQVNNLSNARFLVTEGGVSKYATGAQLQAAASAASKYTSPETSLPAVNTTVTWTHGLGQAPDLIQLLLRCKTAEYGYSVGDEIRFTSAYTYYVGAYTFWANSSTIGFRHATTAGTVFNIVDRSVAGTLRNPTATKWRLVVKGMIF